MEFNFEQLKRNLLVPKMELRQMAHHLEGIKKLYTVSREGLPSKVWSEEEVSSYAAFYLPTNSKKFKFLMDQIPAAIKEELGECEVIDFGTGPGTYLLSYLEYFGGSHCKTLWGIDKEPLMLKQAEKLLSSFFPNFKTKVRFSPEVPIHKNDHKRLLIFGNSCNELGPKQILSIINEVGADFILFIEPGIPVVFDQLMQVRRHLHSKKFDCFYPCPNISSPCPIEKRSLEGLEDWCHQVWRGVHEQGVETLGQLAHIDRKAMPFIGHLYGKVRVTLKKEKRDLIRFVRFIRETKHSFEWQACIEEEGKELRLIELEIPKKTLSKSEMKTFKNQLVGVSFDYEVIKEISEERLRVKVTFEESNK